MRFLADLHIHSRYSRACSKELTPENLCRWGQLKGLSVIGSGDFTHPLWFKELKKKLEPATGGLLALRREMEPSNIPASCRSPLYFLLSTEISCIYSKWGKIRKIHALVLVPDFASATRLTKSLAKVGNLGSDGRPILGLDAKQLLLMVLDASPDALLIPAHAWTPHFSVFGSASGFDSLEECFEDLTQHIYAIETGLSSDPAMNWRLSELDRITLISNSDAHSPAKLGREATIFDTELSYSAISKAIRDRHGIVGTIEFFPEEGKYHMDGHRGCGVRLTPAETTDLCGLCPKCGKKVTVGVLHRVELLADRFTGDKPSTALPFFSVIPLMEIIAEVLQIGVSSKKATRLYFSLLEQLGKEFTILLDTSINDIYAVAPSPLAVAINKMRSGQVVIAPGYDGEFGKIRLLTLPNMS